MHIYLSIYLSLYIYIYMYTHICFCLSLSLYLSLSIYIYIYTYISAKPQDLERYRLKADTEYGQLSAAIPHNGEDPGQRQYAYIYI